VNWRHRSDGGSLQRCRSRPGVYRGPAGREIPGRAAAVRGTPSSVFLQPQLMDIFSGGSQLVCWAGPREGVSCRLATVRLPGGPPGGAGGPRGGRRLIGMQLKQFRWSGPERAHPGDESHRGRSARGRDPRRRHWRHGLDLRPAPPASAAGSPSRRLLTWSGRSPNRAVGVAKVTVDRAAGVCPRWWVHHWRQHAGPAKAHRRVAKTTRRDRGEPSPSSSPVPARNSQQGTPASVRKDRQGSADR